MGVLCSIESGGREEGRCRTEETITGMRIQDAQVPAMDVRCSKYEGAAEP